MRHPKKTPDPVRVTTASVFRNISIKAGSEVQWLATCGANLSLHRNQLKQAERFAHISGSETVKQYCGHLMLCAAVTRWKRSAQRNIPLAFEVQELLDAAAGLTYPASDVHAIWHAAVGTIIDGADAATRNVRLPTAAAKLSWPWSGLLIYLHWMAGNHHWLDIACNAVSCRMPSPLRSWLIRAAATELSFQGDWKASAKILELSGGSPTDVLTALRATPDPTSDIVRRNIRTIGTAWAARAVDKGDYFELDRAMESMEELLGHV